MARWLGLVAGGAWLSALAWWLGTHRTDLVGHFLAGFGGTLGAAWLAARLGRGRPWVVVVATLAAIGLGHVAESTTFALAGFDAIDFVAQSIGALQAGVALLAVGAGDAELDPDQDDPLFRNQAGRIVCASSAIALVAGGALAFA